MKRDAKNWADWTTFNTILIWFLADLSNLEFVRWMRFNHACNSKVYVYFLICNVSLKITLQFQLLEFSN
jgi:hypothetical protein